MSNTTSPPGATLAVQAPEQAEADRIRKNLLERAVLYDFFHAVGMMERLSPTAIRVGGGGPYQREFIRFRHDNTLSFSASDIAKISYEKKPRPPEERLEQTEHRFEVTTSFLGLTGTVTPLPMYLAEEVLQNEDYESGAIKRDFLDIFHHRVISFVYRIGVKYDLAREYMLDASDPWSRRILSLAGFDLWARHKPKAIPIWQILRLAPLLANKTRSARTLELALEDVCEEALAGAQVRIEQYTGEWSPLDEEQRVHLGARNHILGHDAVLGVQCYDRGGRAVIVIGPLSANFRRFLSDGDMFPMIVELLSLLCDEPIEFELELVIHENARPPLVLGAGEGARIGLDAWLSSGGSGEESRMTVELPQSLPPPRPGLR